MTRLIRGLVLAIFTLGLVFSVGSTWTTKHLYEVDGFVDATAAIGKNEQVRSTMINVTAEQGFRQWLNTFSQKPLEAIVPIALVLFVISLLVQSKFKLHPLLLIFGAGAARLLLGLVF